MPVIQPLLKGKSTQPSSSGNTTTDSRILQPVIANKTKPTVKPSLNVQKAVSSGGLTLSKPQQKSNPIGDFIGQVYKGAVGEIGSILHPQKKEVLKPVDTSRKLPLGLKLNFTDAPKQQTSQQSAQTKVTPKAIESQKKTVKTAGKVNDAITGTFHGTIEQLQHAMSVSHALNDWDTLKKDPKKVVDDFLNTVPDAYHQIEENVKTVKQDFKTNAPVSQKAGDILKTISSQANFVFSPLSAIFGAADKTPVLGTLSRLMALPFTAAGEGATAVSNQIVDHLPISQQAKNNIRPGMGEIFALASQLVLGHITTVGESKKAELIKKYGAKDAEVIVNKAVELAQEKTVAPGTYSPQELRNHVFEKKIEDTPHGQELLKASIDADREGQQITIIKQQPIEDYFRPAENDIQVKNQKYLSGNLDKAKADYFDRIDKEYGTRDVISADDAKYILPGFEAKLSDEYHSPASSLSKLIYDEKIQTNKGKGNNTVLFLSGGTGAGKTTAMRMAQQNIKENAIVYDTNLVGEKSAASKIDKALKNGYNVDIMYVQRDPVVAFEHGVIPRVRSEGRLINLDDHIDRHLEAFKTLEQLKEKYGDKITVRYIDNTGGLKDAKVVPFDNLPKFSYNKDELKQILHTKVDEAVDQYGTDSTRGLTKEEAKAIRGKPTESRQDSRSAGTGTTESSQGVDNRTNTAKSPNEPVGTGKTKESSAYKHRLEQLAATDPEKYEYTMEKNGKVTYNVNKANEDMEKAANLLEKDPQKAYNVATGREPAPQGQTANAVAIAVSDRAVKENNMDVFIKTETALSLRSTRYGQENAALRGRFDEGSPHAYVQKLLDTRLNKIGEAYLKDVKDVVQKTMSVKKAAIEKIDTEVKKVKEILTKEQRKVQVAQSIIDGLTCK